MLNANNFQSTTTVAEARSGERGAALALSILMLALLGAIAMTVLTVVHTETRIAGSDLDRTQTYYAAAAGMEKMTTDFSALFARTSRPTLSQLSTIANSPPPELLSEGFTFSPAQTIAVDDATLTAMGASPRVTIPAGPFVGLTASVTPYVLTTTANSIHGTQVSLRRQMNNYLIPIFQFGMFSNEDMEIHPGPQFTFNGRVHANGNLYFNGNVTFLAKVTTANEAVRDVLRNGATHTGTVSFQIGAVNVQMTQGSVFNGPNLPGAAVGQRGYFPGSPDGTSNPSWKSNSVAAATAGVPDRFGAQLLTRTTGVAPLLLPLQLDGNPTREVIKRMMPNDDVTLSQSRYHSKAEVRILIDDETGPADASGIPAGLGVRLSTFDPIPLPNVAASSNGGRALWRVRDDGTYNEVTTGTKSYPMQQNGSSPTQALTVRGVKGATQSVTLNGTPTKIPAGSGLTGRILIQIVDANGVTRDVTQQILSMGMTEGEPNAIVMLQRPLWAAFAQGSRDASNSNNPALNGDPAYQNDLTDILNKTHLGADGEIKIASGFPSQDPTYGYLTNIVDDTASGSQPQRADTPGALGAWNSMVPINIYNVREGRINLSLDANTVWERGCMSVVEINMRNLARWLDGVYDANLLANTGAVSANIASPDGYVVYVSDRRGDKVKAERDTSGTTLMTTNGVVDNEDIYGPNNSLDPGEDVIDAGIDMTTLMPKKGTLQRDLTELPNPAALSGTSGGDFNARVARAKTVAAWSNPTNYFRRGVRIFNGEALSVTAGANKLSPTKGITFASENMVYIWGNYNTTGINGQPAGGSTLNDSTQAYFYQGSQVPASIVVDAFFPLSKTWFDALGAMYPDDLSKRVADAVLPGTSSETSVRSGIIAGNNLSALAGSPDAGNTGESRLCGGMHNFPRFLENWGTQRWNFVGSLIPLFHSTQAMGQYNADSTIYSPPIRNWAFDSTFLDPNKLPPGTPQFQYIEPTAFRQVL
jgi:Tfp pilus assembly protein PilX